MNTREYNQNNEFIMICISKHMAHVNSKSEKCDHFFKSEVYKY